MKNFLDYEKMDVRIQILNHYKLNFQPQKDMVTFSVPKLIYEWTLKDQNSNLFVDIIEPVSWFDKMRLLLSLHKYLSFVLIIAFVFITY